MKTNRKTIKMPVRYLMNAVLVALLFVTLEVKTLKGYKKRKEEEVNA